MPSSVQFGTALVLLFLVLSLNLLATLIRSRARRRRMW
jgi:phosphate transport system permease protein